jgi:hypothetical protein
MTSLRRHRSSALLIALALLATACGSDADATSAQPSPTTSSITTPGASAPGAAPQGAEEQGAVATFAEVPVAPQPTTTLPPVPTGPVEVCGVPIDSLTAMAGPRSNPGTAGMLTGANAPGGVSVTDDEITLSDGAQLIDVEIPADTRVRVEPAAEVLIERVLARDGWIFMEPGSRLTMRDSDFTRLLTEDNWYVLDGHGEGGVLEHNRFAGGEAATIFLRSESSGWSIVNNEVLGGEDGFKPGGTGHVIERNWIHDLATGIKLSSGQPRHSDGLQLQGGNVDLTIRCNVIDATVDGANAAIIIKPDLGDIRNVVVEGNAMGGGAYTLFSIVAGTDFPMADVAITGNVFEAGTGFYGSITVDNTVTMVTGNVTEADQPVNPG